MSSSGAGSCGDAGDLFSARTFLIEPDHASRWIADVAIHSPPGESRCGRSTASSPGLWEWSRLVTQAPLTFPEHHRSSDDYRPCPSTVEFPDLAGVERRHGGGPSRLPFCRALARPVRTRSRRISRSNWVKTASKPAMVRPAVSSGWSASVKETKPLLRCSSSCSKPSRSRRDSNPWY